MTDHLPDAQANPWGYDLFKHLHDEHGLILTLSELQGIVRIAARLRERQGEYVAPIARVTVGENDSLSVSLYAPGLPPGEHDLFPVAGHHRTCCWAPLPDEIDAYEGCASIHHVGRDDEGPALPAFCEDCGGAVVVSQSEPNT